MQGADFHDFSLLELAGSCDPLSFTPLKEDAADLEDFKASTLFVAVQGLEVLGFVGIKGKEVSWLYVEPKYFRQGVGWLLLQEALVRVERPAEIYVLSGNAGAIKLYKKAGFQRISTFPSDVNGFPCTIHKYVKRDE